MIKINGEERQAAGQKLDAYLTEEGYLLTRIAVEYNGSVLPRTLYSETILQKGDVIEVVSFVGGG